MIQLKLRINESNYLIEDIAAVKKYYPNIDDNTFMTLIALDPTYRDGSNSVGKYGKWILNLYNKGTISEDDFGEITPLLNQFNTYKNRIQNKDLNAYKTLDDLDAVVSAVVDDDSMLSDRQKLRFKKNVKAGRVKVSAEDDYDIVLDTSKFTVYVPNTHEASMKLGKGTEWCTAHEDPSWYKDYTQGGKKLYIVKDKKTGERWQYSDDTQDFLDQNDESFDVLELLKSDPKLSKYFERLTGYDVCNFDGNYTYDGEPVPSTIKSMIKIVKVSEGVEEIPNCAFQDCTQLQKVTLPDGLEEIHPSAFYNCKSLISLNIPESVKNISSSAFYGTPWLDAKQKENPLVIINNNLITGKQCEGDIVIPEGIKSIPSFAFSEATKLRSVKLPKTVSRFGFGYSSFADCSSLKSINIPEGVTKITDSAFENCTSLKNLTLPNSIKKIEGGAFQGCTSLESINIPEGTEEIQSYAFKKCPKLTIYSDSDVVKKYCEKFNIPIKPDKSFKKESISRPLKLSIVEDTCCVPGKIDYMGEDGWSNNVYYFGDKPKKPVNWKELMKKKKTKEVKEMKLSIKEEQEKDTDTHYFYVMAWEQEADKEDRPNYMKKFNIFEEADEAYNKCLKKFGKESHIILFEYIDGSRKIIKSTQEE